MGAPTDKTLWSLCLVPDKTSPLFMKGIKHKMLSLKSGTLMHVLEQVGHLWDDSPSRFLVLCKSLQVHPGVRQLILGECQI